MVIKNGIIELKSTFRVSIDDYGIKVPKSVENRVAKIVDVKIDLQLTKKEG
jgi:hypothetical protein